MSDKLLWSSNMTQDYMRSLSDDEKHNMLIDRGYDADLLGDDLDQIIDNDDYMWQDDADDYITNIAPMINKQTLGGNVVALNKLDNQGDVLVISSDDLVGGDICPEADTVEIVDDGSGLVAKYSKDGNSILELNLYSIPEDTGDQDAFVQEFMPQFENSFNLEDDENNYTPEDYSDYLDQDSFDAYLDKDKFKQDGPRIKNTIGMPEVEECYLHESWDDLLERLELDEKIPKDLAHAYKNKVETHSKFTGVPWLPGIDFYNAATGRRADDTAGYGANQNRFSLSGYTGNGGHDIDDYYGATSIPEVDFENATYTKITPEEALARYKAGNSRNVYAIINNQICNRYKTPGDPNYYDFKATGSFEKDNGKTINTTTRLTPAEMYNMASAIYSVDNEPLAGQDIKDKRDARAANPEPTLGIAQTYNGKNYDDRGNKIGRHRSWYLKKHPAEQDWIANTTDRKYYSDPNEKAMAGRAAWNKKRYSAMDNGERLEALRSESKDLLAKVAEKQRKVEEKKREQRSKYNATEIQNKQAQLLANLNDLYDRIAALTEKIAAAQEEYYDLPERSKREADALEPEIAALENEVEIANEYYADFMQKSFPRFFGLKDEEEVTESLHEGREKPYLVVPGDIEVAKKLMHQDESLTEAKSKDASGLQVELQEIIDDYDDFGAEGFYEVPYNSFKNEFPNFSKEVVDTFLKEMGILQEGDDLDALWQEGELIQPEDWDCLIDGAQQMANGKQVQWEKLYKKYYQSEETDEPLTEGWTPEEQKYIEKAKEIAYSDDVDVIDAFADELNDADISPEAEKEIDRILGFDVD